MTILFVFLLLINALLVFVLAFMAGIIQRLSRFRQRTMNRFIYHTYRVRTVRYRADINIPFSDLQGREFFDYLMKEYNGHGSPMLGYVCDTLIDAIMDKVRDDLKKNSQNLRLDYVRDGYQYRFIGDLEIAIVPPNDDETESFRNRVITDPYLTHPIISKHF